MARKKSPPTDAEIVEAWREHDRKLGPTADALGMHHLKVRAALKREGALDEKPKSTKRVKAEVDSSAPRILAGAPTHVGDCPKCGHQIWIAP